MDHQGHGLALNHPIFNEPKDTEWTETETPREKQYTGNTSVLYPDGMPETYKLIDFETSKPDGYNVTLVNHEGFFTDIPGFENLAEGHSAKVLGSLSLARQGRYFYWGYSIDPKRLTPGAKNTLINVLHYMHEKRNSLTVEFVCSTRQILQVYIELYKADGYLRGIEEHLPGTLTEKWRETYTATPEGAEQWLAKHHAYVFSGKTEEHKSQRYKTVFEVDEDAMTLGTPNKERASLEQWIELAGGKDKQKKVMAMRCLKRYVHPAIAPRKGWKRWYKKASERIVFIESTGFWWQLNPVLLEKPVKKRK